MLTRHGRGRWVLLLAAALLLALGAVPVLPASPAAAEPDCDWAWTTGPDGDEVMVWRCSDSDGSSGGGGDGRPMCETNVQGRDVRVPCVHSSLGFFSTLYNGCYLRPARPQPEAGDEAWEGNDPEDGVVYTAHCFHTEGVDGAPMLWHPSTIFLSVLEGWFADLLEEAIAKLGLRGPDIQLAPDPAGAGLVGLPVWMWTPETTAIWGPQSDDATSLGITLHVEAHGERIRWDMGDGTEVVCDGPGEPYDPAFGAEPSECPHVYEEPSRDQPDGRYQVTATTEWRIDWEIDQTAVSGFELRTRTADPVSVRINELQVVTS